MVSCSASDLHFGIANFMSHRRKYNLFLLFSEALINERMRVAFTIHKNPSPPPTTTQKKNKQKVDMLLVVSPTIFVVVVVFVPCCSHLLCPLSLCIPLISFHFCLFKVLWGFSSLLIGPTCFSYPDNLNGIHYIRNDCELVTVFVHSYDATIFILIDRMSPKTTTLR